MGTWDCRKLLLLHALGLKCLSSWESKLRLWRLVMAPPSLSLDRESPVTMSSLSRTARRLTAAGIVDSLLSSLLERKRLLLDGMKVWPKCPQASPSHTSPYIHHLHQITREGQSNPHQWWMEWRECVKLHRNTGWLSPL